MSRAILAESDALFSERLTEAAAAAHLEPLRVTSLEEAVDCLEEDSPDVLVIGPSLSDDASFSLVERLNELSRLSVVMVAREVDASVLRRAMRAGVTDVVDAAEPIAEITNALARAGVSAMRARTETSAPEVIPSTCKIVTVFSTKGGVGKTVISTNLAVALAQTTGKRVAIVDLDLEFGDVAIMLGMIPEHTIHDAIQVFDRLDGDMLEGFMDTHSSGLSALLAPMRPEEAESISAARVGQIIDLMRCNYDYVVIDTCPSFSEPVLAALDRSDEVYVVTMMDVASIKNTRISLQKLRQLGYDNGRVRLVLNRSDSKVLLEPSEVEKAVGGVITAHIPSDRIVPRSVNKGVPVIVEAPRSDVAKSLMALAKSAAAVADKEVGHVA